MGLDQYAFSFPNKEIKVAVGNNKIIIEEYDPQVDFKHPKNVKEIFYWRKHPSIQGWMEQLYHSKGGKETSFNCVPVRLTLDDLNRLENDIKNNRLPETKGFFFGEDDGSEIQEDLRFVYIAKEEIKKGRLIAYSSWW
jgi:hypothetical protein